MKKLGIVAISFFLALGLPYGGVAAEPDVIKELDALKKRVQELEQQIKEAKPAAPEHKHAHGHGHGHGHGEGDEIDEKIEEALEERFGTLEIHGGAILYYQDSQADELGASIGPVLRAQSDLFRTQRFQRAEKAGAAAAQKILFPLVLCILPAVFIIIFGPIALSFLYGGGFGGAG